jgi:hypothetical protein
VRRRRQRLELRHHILSRVKLTPSDVLRHEPGAHYEKCTTKQKKGKLNLNKFSILVLGRLLTRRFAARVVTCRDGIRGGKAYWTKITYLHVGDGVTYTLRVVDPVDRKRPGTAALQSILHVGHQRALPSS